MLDIVIPVYNQPALLKSCLESIPGAVGNNQYRVFIVDNASTDKEMDNLYSQLHGVNVFKSNKNAGFPTACNYGAKSGYSKYLMFLNSDITLFPNSISIALDEFRNPDVGVVGMKLLFHPDTNTGPAGHVQHVGLETNIRGEFYHIFIGWDANNYKVKRKTTALAVTGAAMLVKRENFEKYGGFDVGYGLGTYEDISLCLQHQMDNKLVVISQEAVAYHWVGATSRGEKIHFPLQRNRDYFMSKWANKFPWTEWKYL